MLTHNKEMKIGEIAEIQMCDFFDLVEKNEGTYEVETPQGWIEIGDLKREKKECFVLKTADGALSAGHDHLVETQNGWEKVEDLDIERTCVNTNHGKVEVIAREYIGIQDTFDFEVLNKEHKYYANGIVSHNCGKTLSCKWLRGLCLANGLDYKIIGVDDYREAQSRGNLRTIFRLGGKRHGIIFFDDMDGMVKDKNISIDTSDLSTFLSQLDGIDPVDGVVFVFTTNYIKELDEAFVRPGRIDLWLMFRHPTKEMRIKFINEKFDSQILEITTVDDLEQRMGKEEKDYNFAEIEEIRKLFCIDLINGKKLDVDRTFKTFDKHRKEFEERAIISGFSKLKGNDADDYDDESDTTMPWE